jgi:putative transcriptional regulator
MARMDRNNRLTRLGQRVLQRREQLGLSQDDLAKRWHSDRSQVSRLENGRVDPKASDLLLLAAALETTVTELLEEDAEAIAERARELVDDPMTVSYFVRLGGGLRRATPKDRDLLERILKNLADSVDPPEERGSGTSGSLAQLAEQNGVPQ